MADLVSMIMTGLYGTAGLGGIVAVRAWLIGRLRRVRGLC